NQAAGRTIRNTLAAGLAERQNACGAGVRPQREFPFSGGRPAVKQEASRATVGIPLLQEGEDVKTRPPVT
ncbi:hypothetical protein AB0M50_40580, partial [Nonomuraea fuscirosea]